MAVLRSILLWLAIIALTVVFFCAMLPCALLALPFDRKRNTTHFFAKHWARSLFRVNPAIRVKVEGAEVLEGERPAGHPGYVLCANHESMADIIALYYLGHSFKWISKREVFFVPLIGQAMWLAGYVPLKRGDKASIARCMAASYAWLKKGVSIFMFPEGTRSYDGRMKAFKDGAFRMSADTGAAIVPIAMKGPRDLVAKGSWIFSPRVEVVIRVGNPIAPARTWNALAADRSIPEREKEIDRLREETRRWILANAAEMRGVRPEDMDASRGTMGGIGGAAGPPDGRAKGGGTPTEPGPLRNTCQEVGV